MIITKEKRGARLSIRATRSEKELISRAAVRRSQSISEFMLESSLDAAEALELDNADFVLSPKDYKAFLKMLDEPPRTIPALQKLFSEPPMIDAPISD